MTLSSVSFWADFFGIAVVALTVFAAIAGYFSWYFNSRVDALKDEALQRFKIESAEKIASAEAQSASANEKAAASEKEAAIARLEAERIKGVVAWRSVAVEGAGRMEKVLSAKPGSVNLRYTDGDPEALYLAIQLEHILVKSHWKIGVGAVKPANGIVFGINLPEADNPDRQTLGEALLAAKISFGSQPMLPIAIGFGMSNIPDAPILMIGSRAPVLP